MKVVKNTLAIKALESASEDKNYSAVFDSLKGPSALLFTDVANAPAKIIKDFRKENKSEKPGARIFLYLCQYLCLFLFFFRGKM